ncbi:hypothetical protein [Enterococcus sp. AZ109]|uniref:hypothetical protein n=1 Tax=Enterococcus sp. AZ109 TaxID=2774634 RepID=UPI003F23E8E1
MNDEKMKKIIHYQVVLDDAAKERVITRGKSLLEQQQLKRHSFFDLLGIVLRFIPVSVWVKQLGWFAVILLYIQSVKFDLVYGREFSVLMGGLTILVLFSLLLLLDELFKSFNFGTWELEQTLKYSLDEQFLAKILIFGLFELGVVLALSLICQNFLMLIFWKVALYLLVPLNLFTIVVLSLLVNWESNGFRTSLWVVSGIAITVVGGTLIFSRLYEASMSVWFVCYLVTSLILGGIIFKCIDRTERVAL